MCTRMVVHIVLVYGSFRWASGSCRSAMPQRTWFSLDSITAPRIEGAVFLTPRRAEGGLVVFDVYNL